MTTAEEILDFQQVVRMVPIADSVARYAVNLVRATRATDPSAPDFVKKYVNFGASVRAAQFLVLAAKARALMKRRYHVTYEDVTRADAAHPAASHSAELPGRIRPADARTISCSKLLEAMPAPENRRGASAMLQRFLDPTVLAGISGLDLVAQTVVDGFIAGLHRSPDFGFSQEFAEYRAYTPGDDLRHVDWNVFARTERDVPEALSRRNQLPADDSAGLPAAP